MFLLTFRPFKVGDTISAAGVVGCVLTFVGNNRLFSDNVQNFSANEYRRVDLTAHLPSVADVEGTIARLRASVDRTANVLRSPSPAIEILSVGAGGCLLAVRPYCRSADYWQVYFDVNRAITHALA